MISVKGATIWFLWGGQEDFAKKNFRLRFQGKKFSGPKGRQKKFSGLPKEALSHSDTCFHTPKSTFRTPKSAFALRKLLYALPKTTLYTLGMTFRITKRKYFALWKNSVVNPPPLHGLMKWGPGGFKKNSPARRAGEKNSPAPKIGKKNSPAHLSLPAPP